MITHYIKTKIQNIKTNDSYSTYKIYFNNNQKVVYSGQKVYITVRLKCTDNVKIRGINIYLRGKIQGKPTATNFIGKDILDIQKCLQSGNGGNVYTILTVIILRSSIYNTIFIYRGNCTFARSI